MSQPDAVIARCRACGQAMNVTDLPPYSEARCPSCGEMTRVKESFGPYRLKSRHAVGGMSVVFYAEDETLGRGVAVKILSEHYSGDERRIAAFEEEARITASFTHPHVVRIYTTGRAFGRFYIAMEWVPGGHFEQHITSRGKIPEREVLPLAVQVAEGLMAAHAAGLIHRDIKPGNILLDAAGSAKIVDFGLALVTHGGTARAEERWATPYYVPPEAVEGRPEDFRADMYAFGATLYHALAGKPPCEEETMDTERLREAKRKVVPLLDAAPWVSEETCAVVDRAMAFDPGERFATYAELLAQLRHAARLAAEAPDEPVAPRRARRERVRARLATAGAAAVLAGAVAFASWKVLGTLGEEPVEVVENPVVPATPEPESEPETVADHTSAAEIAALYREARGHLAGRRFEHAREAFARLRDDPAVREPTRSWSAVEVVLASFLAGEAGRAAEDAAVAASHLADALPEESPLRSAALPVLAEVGKLGPVSSADVPSASHAPAVAARMLAGLENWEQGQLAAAVPHFAAVAGAELLPDEAWARVYTEFAADYLADHAILSSSIFDGYPATRVETESAIGELNEKLALLKTRGRAPFNVRSWQLDLTRHASRLAVAEAKAAAIPDRAETISRLEALTRELRFTEASAFLRSLPRNIEGLPVTAWLRLHDAADAFLDALEDDIRSLSAGQAALELRDGGTVTRLAVPERRRLLGTGSDGEAAEFSWSDFTPESINQLYRTLAGRVPSEADRLVRHESAIAFEWLVGDKDRAAAAAERLARDYPVFGRRWEKVMEEVMNDD